MKKKFKFLFFLFLRIAVFSINVLKDERIVIIAEQRPDCSEEEVSIFHSCLSLFFVFFVGFLMCYLTV